jgi:NitT/TauT family transport system substrate-binding protein
MNSSRVFRMVTIILLSFFLGVANLSAETLKVPYVSLSATRLPIWIAEAAGLFKKQQLDVQLLYIGGGSVLMQAMLSGDAQISNMAPPAAIAAWAKGADLAVVAVNINRLLHVIMVPPEIKKPEDLKGKKIGISRYGSLTDVALREALRYYKLRPDKDVAIIQSGGQSERVSAMKAGALDGALLVTDSMFQAEKLGFHVLVDLSKLPIDYPADGIVVRKQFLQTNRDVVKRFLKAWIEGIKVLKTDKDFSIKVMGKYLRTDDQEILSKSYEIYKTGIATVPYGDRKGFVFALERLADTSPEVAKLNIDELIDNRLVSELENEGFFKNLYSEKPTR